MCDYCRVNELGDSISMPIIKVPSKLFETNVTVEARLYGNRLSCYLGTRNDVLIDEYREIRYCPMCGEKIKEVYDDHDVSGLLDD